MPSMKPLAGPRIILVIAMTAVISGCDGGFYLAGSVVDSEGQPIHGATLRAASAEGSEKFEAVSDERGCLSVGSTLAPGEYNFDVIVRAPGYKTLQISVPTLDFHRFRIVLANPGQAFLSQAQPLQEKEFRDLCSGI